MAKRKRKKNYPCFKGVCVDKSSYKLSLTLLDTLYKEAKEAGQTPTLELMIKIKDNQYYKLDCILTKTVL